MGSTSSELATFRRLLRQARPYWPHLAGILFLSVLSGPILLLTPLPLKVVVDSVLGSHPLPDLIGSALPEAITQSTSALLLLAGVLTVVIGLLQHLEWFSTWVLRTYTSEKLVLDFRGRLLQHVQRLSLRYHDTRGTMDSMYRIQYDALAIAGITIDGVIPLLSAILTLVGMIYVTVLIDWELALVALAVAPVLFLLNWPYRQSLRNKWSAVMEVESRAMAVVQETLTALRVVKAFGQEERERERFMKHASEGARGQVRLAFIQWGLVLLTGMTTVIGTAIVLTVGVLHVQSGKLTLGELLLVIAYLGQLYGPLETLSKTVVQLQSSFANAERAFALLDESPDVSDRPNARRIGRAAGAVILRNVSFGYGGDNPILRDISVEVGPGTRVGITGATGAGKTTLISLLTRFYDPSHGQILLDGVDLRDYRLSDLRNQFAIVLQDPVLFSTSIFENIAYGRTGANEADIVAAAKAADAHDFIVQLPGGYETLVGERGMRLSGGERQRISLARAFLKDAPILILDEPTSSVDLRTEATIMEAMDRLMRSRTSFMIAHRLSTLESCDLLLIIDDGRLGAVASGLSPTLRDALAQRRLDSAVAGLLSSGTADRVG